MEKCSCGGNREPFSWFCADCLKVLSNNAIKEHQKIQKALRDGKDITIIPMVYNSIYESHTGICFGFSTLRGALQ